MMHHPEIRWAAEIGEPADLITTPESTRAGFVEQARAKAAAAQPFIERATALHEALATIHDVDKLLELTEHRSSIIAACGLSIKAQSHLRAEEEVLVRQALAALYEQTVADFGEEASDAAILAAFRTHIVYRYLLTAGDTLGGSMRNYIGATGAAKLSAAILAALANVGYQNIEVTRTPKGKVQRIVWDHRLIVFDRKPILYCGDRTITCNNIDVIVLKIPTTRTPLDTELGREEERNLLQAPDNYLACGELKGGIDPAGADEHWKTTGSALDRISNDFAACGQYKPQLFFTGSAIEPVMAEELYNRLAAGIYGFAANLTRPSQLQALARWLITLN